MSGNKFVVVLVSLGVLLATGLWFSAQRVIETPYTAAVEQTSPTSIRFPAIVNADGFDHGDMPGYHAIVWRGGRAAEDALFQAQVTDVQVLDAVEALGLIPGNNLTMASWEEREDRNSRAPDEHIQGPQLLIEIELENETPRDLAHFLKDPANEPLDLRLGGNRALIPEWRSGCVLCLYSCPGSKVGNRAYTVRDYVNETTKFSAHRDRLPPDGTPIWIHFRWEASGS